MHRQTDRERVNLITFQSKHKVVTHLCIVVDVDAGYRRFHDIRRKAQTNSDSMLPKYPGTQRSSVKPDLANFRHFCIKLKIFGNFWRVNLVLSQNLEPAQPNYYAVGQMFIAVNGQILNKKCINLVTICTQSKASLGIFQTLIHLIL